MSSSPDRPRVLCVDDEPHVLAALTRELRKDYEAATATGGAQGLEILERERPFAVVISDMRMPEMDGAAFLKAVRERKPNTVRMLLTGQADLEDTMAAVNQGNIFRFLMKPCPPPIFLQALRDAVAQHRLIVSERVLLRETLLGSIHTLMEILSLSNPPAFGRATRVRQVVSEMINRKGEVQDSWQIEVAAMLSQIGCIALAGSTVERLYYGQTLTPDEQAQVDRLPEMAGQLLSHIPRLEPVREILSHQGKHFDGSGVPPGNLQGEAIPWGARALKVILDFDILRSRDLEPAVALEVMRSRTGWYDPALLEDFAKMQVNVTPSVEERELPLAEVEEGMVFAEDVKTRTGALLIARGHQATRGTLKRIRSLSPEVGVKEPIKISVQKSFSHQT